MITVFKYPLALGHNIVELPWGSTILTVQFQIDQPCMWALVDTENEKEQRLINVIGTGFDMCNAPIGDYIATFQTAGGALVWHAFDAGKVVEEYSECPPA